jgi:hypothetical protein
LLKATNMVLALLGEEMAEVIKYHLRCSCAISFADDATVSLDQLHFAPSVLLGDGTANSILGQIASEINDIERPS